MREFVIDIKSLLILFRAKKIECLFIDLEFWLSVQAIFRQ
jgi:hypothetical protein